MYRMLSEQKQHNYKRPFVRVYDSRSCNIGFADFLASHRRDFYLLAVAMAAEASSFSGAVLDASCRTRKISTKKSNAATSRPVHFGASIADKTAAIQQRRRPCRLSCA